ncbi:MAG: hypothetical protein KDA96_09290, partial [Planctomycetaceae bacterium]|nr:hypothetical protein [Planctomycetaceae bacterium]
MQMISFGEKRWGALSAVVVLIAAIVLPASGILLADETVTTPAAGDYPTTKAPAEISAILNRVREHAYQPL